MTWRGRLARLDQRVLGDPPPAAAREKSEDPVAQANRALAYGGGWFGPSRSWPTAALVGLTGLCVVALVLAALAGDWWAAVWFAAVGGVAIGLLRRRR